VVVLLAAVLGSRLLLRPVLAASPVPGLMARFPWFLRFAAGFALTFGVGYAITTALYRSAPVSQWFPIIISLAIGIVIFEVLLTEPVARRGAAGVVIGSLAVSVFLGLAFFASPAVVLADNDSGLFGGAVAQEPSNCGDLGL